MTRILCALLLLATPAIAQPVLFPFMQYTSPDAFHTAAQQAFPAGSSFKKLQQSMALSGAERSSNRATPNAVYTFRQPIGMVSANQWTITVATNNDIIRSISTHFDVINTQTK